MGAALEGASDFFANWAPTAPSKNPGEEGLLEEEGLEALDELGDHPGVHFSFLFANWDPMALSKNPGEEGLAPAVHALIMTICILIDTQPVSRSVTKQLYLGINMLNRNHAGFALAFHTSAVGRDHHKELA